MLEPTDRVLAKVVMRAWIDKEHNKNTAAETFAIDFTNAVFPRIKENTSLMLPIIELLREVVDEALAEELGNAVSTSQPYPTTVPQPWMEDAGGGC